MNKTKPNKRRREIEFRYGLITGWQFDMHIHAERPRGGSAQRESRMYLELKGQLTKPLVGVTEFSILTFVSEEPKAGQGEVASIGSLTRIKPSIQGGVDLSFAEFQTVIQMASGQQLRSCYIAFQAPHRGHALITSISFGSALPDEDDMPGS